MSCTCVGFYVPSDCPEHGNRRKLTPEEIEKEIIQRVMSSMDIVLDSLVDGTEIRKILAEKNFTLDELDKCKTTLMQICYALGGK